MSSPLLELHRNVSNGTVQASYYANGLTIAPSFPVERTAIGDRDRAECVTRKLAFRRRYLKNGLCIILKIQAMKHAGFRDRAIHDYDQLDLDYVWLTIQDGLPLLKSALKQPPAE